MSTTDGRSVGVRLALLEGQLLAGEISKTVFLERAVELAVAQPHARATADKLIAIAENQFARRSRLRRTYDYIVIGAGASGCVVARRLAENTQNHVLLLEAGDQDLKTNVLVTENWFLNIGGEMDWSFSAEPSPSVNGRSIHQAMGRALGGGTSINGMVWARGHRDDFEHWAAETGDPCWGYDHVLEIYKRIEDWHGPPDPARRGTGGLLFVQPAPDPNPLAPAFLDAAASIGIPTFDDQNGKLQETSTGGAAITNVRVRNGRRLNVAAEYLYPVMDQPNLTILTGALVRKITLDGTTATGVEFEWQGSVHRLETSAEVIVSAGAFQTPKLLMLSGIGDTAELAKVGIASVAHVPGVGRNLQDHPIVAACLWQSPGSVTARANAAEANAFARSRQDLDTPDLHIWLIEAPYLSEVTMKYAVEDAWSICPGLLRPYSRGHVRLRSADPNAAPEIHANMLDDVRDLEALRRAMEVSRAIGHAEALRPFVRREILPGEASRDALDDLIRDGVTSMHHPTCTAKMGRDDMSVVDSELLVHGISRLRVADGSIMPSVTTGNTQAPCVIIGERLAEIVNGINRRANRSNVDDTSNISRTAKLGNAERPASTHH